MSNVPVKYTPPPECNTIISAIRKAVPRPTTLPQRTYPECKLGFIQPSTSSSHNSCCPMGMLPSSKWNWPGIKGFERGNAPGSPEAIKAFAEWWDGLVDPQAAVDAVWGRVDGVALL